MQKLTLLVLTIFSYALASGQNYPRNYFRHPLNIPMQLVANFGEIRTNHWHMGLDIRTLQRENLPVYASAEGFVSRVVVEPGGFGQAIYIDHPNGYTTLYAHMNGFYPELAKYVKEQQYAQESWQVNLTMPAGKFPLRKGDYIGLSGNTGGSAGPHVHFEIRDTKTENCLNPLLFGFPIPDAVPPTVYRLAMYDRNRSTYLQNPQLITLKRVGAYLVPAGGPVLRVGSNKLSFAVSAVDRFSGSNNPNGVYKAEMAVDGQPVSGFVHDDISYNDTRYINAEVDLSLQARSRISVQHVSPLPGAPIPYKTYTGEGMVQLQDTGLHEVSIAVWDANGNATRIKVNLRYDDRLSRVVATTGGEKFSPNAVNVYESPELEVFTSEYAIYDTIPVTHSALMANQENAVSALHQFIPAYFPAHDSVTVRIKPSVSLTSAQLNRVVIQNKAGTRTYLQKARWQRGWLAAQFRQFGSYQAFVDEEPPTINAPLTDLSKATRIVFTPKDNFNVIKRFRAELDGQWLSFSNDKGKTWIYKFDEHFPPGAHQLKVTIEDEAGNVTERVWEVRR